MGCSVVALIGLRATGKSTVGRRLAARVGWSFVDTDALLAAQVGVPPGEYLADRGEAAFRRVEAPLVVEALRGEGPLVVALGGGAVLSAPVRAELDGPGVLVIWLHAPLSELAQRLGQDSVARPALTGAATPLAELELLWGQRESHYRGLGGTPIQTGALDADAVCDRILARMRGEVSESEPPL